MKHRHSLLSTPGFIATLLASAALQLHAQTWVTVSAIPNAVCGDLSTDAANNVFSVGRYIAADGSSVALVQGSADQGSTWQVLDQYAETGLSYAHHRAFAVDRLNGNLFAGGNLNGAPGYDALWLIREWNPATGLWSTAEHYSALANDVGQASCADILVAPSGDVYATGGSSMGAGPGWLVRKRSAGASTFTTVDADYSRQTAGSGWDLGFHPSYGVFAVGEVSGIWTVRRSSSGNTGTWTTVDSFYTARNWIGGKALCILTTPSKIHVVGSAYKYRQGNHWIVRSSSDGGQTWAITDDYAPSIPSEARGIVQDAAGNLWVCGTTVASAGGLQWVLRKGTPGTKLVKQGKNWVQVETMTWTNVADPYQLAPGKSALPNGITIDTNGNIFIGGNATDANGVDHWVVQKLEAQ
ncbi:MAG: SBBP repeat-containing protein [Verrucomicrobia bacterium]|nr:SBBP repeat-containing protein [Verrucomicrobiota bacterium]